MKLKYKSTVIVFLTQDYFVVTDTVAYLAKNSKDPDAKNLGNYDNRTALHIAALTNNLQLCKILKDAGADINARMKFKVRGSILWMSLWLSIGKKNWGMSDFKL